MKRFFVALILLSAICIEADYANCDTPPPGTAGEGGGNNEGGTDGGGTGADSGLGSIDIDDLICPPGQGGRSLLPTVEAYVDDFGSRIEILFNRELGMATAVVIDAGGYAVASTECDTSSIDAAYLPMPARSGCYTLRIIAHEYLGEGHFEL